MGRSPKAPPHIREVFACGYATEEFAIRLSVFDRTLMEGTRDDVELLLLRQTDEVHGVAGDAHGQMRVLFRMLNGVFELFLAKHVDVRVIQAVAVACVEDADEVADALVSVSYTHLTLPTIA